MNAHYLYWNQQRFRDPSSGQRLLEFQDLPADPVIESAVEEPGFLVVRFRGETEAARYPLDSLHEPEDLSPFAGDAFLRTLVHDGIAFPKNVPDLEQAVASLGIVGETNYGRFFDVRFEPNPENLAYSDRGLGLHTDNPYRDPVPGFQALHVIRASASGGVSLFSDGFAAAESLRRENPRAYDILSSTPVRFEYRSKDSHFVAEWPTIGPKAIHYNDRALRLSSKFSPEFYLALRSFALYLYDSSHMFHVKLSEGEMVVFDNHRMLHGRTAFHAASEPRHLRGCYLTRDSVVSNWRVSCR